MIDRFDEILRVMHKAMKKSTDEQAKLHAELENLKIAMKESTRANQ